MNIGNFLMVYLCREFLIKFAVFSLILLGVVYLFDTIELIKRAGENHALGLSGIFMLALYKLPDVGQQILPFIILFSTMATLWGLSQRRELESIRAAGLSVWQFMSPMIFVTFAFGLLYVTVLHPLTAAAMSRYNNLENMYFGDGQSTISAINDGLWIRQEDETGYFILSAKTLNASQWTMRDVTLFFFDANGEHTQRIDAKTASLVPHEWVFNNARLYKTGEASTVMPELRLSTSLTSATITESFSNPQTISFWRLPHFIRTLAHTGLDTTPMVIYYQSLLVLPLLLLAMVCLAAATSLKTGRHTKLLPIVASGLGIGFVVFFFSGFLRALGAGHEIPVALSIWTPPVIIIFCSIATLITLEDG